MSFLCCPLTLQAQGPPKSSLTFERMSLAFKDVSFFVPKPGGAKGDMDCRLGRVEN